MPRARLSVRPSNSRAKTTTPDATDPSPLLLRTRRKYIVILSAAVSLATVYGLAQHSLVREVSPADLEEYRRIVAQHENLKCECSTPSIKYADFASASASLYSVCAWVERDLVKETLGVNEHGISYSSCVSTRHKTQCADVLSSCKRGEKVRRWMLKEFNNTPVASTELLTETFLNQTLTTKLDSLQEMSELVTMTSIDITSAHAVLNMPRVVSAIGAMAKRLQILTIFDAKHWNTSHQQYAAWADFEQRCIESTTNKEITLYDGTKYTPTVPCDPANDLYTYAPHASAIKKQCYTKECFWGALQLTTSPESRALEVDPGSYAAISGYDTRQMFDLYGAYMSGESMSSSTLVGGWLDLHADGLFNPATRRICSNPSTWHDSEQISEIEFRLSFPWVFQAVGQSFPESAPDNHWIVGGGCDPYTANLGSGSPFDPEGNKMTIRRYEQWRANVDPKIEEILQKVIAGKLTPVLPPGLTKEFYISFLSIWVNSSPNQDDIFHNFHLPLWGDADTKLERQGKLNWTIANMIDTVELDLGYRAYFDACAPKTCSYVVSERLPASTLASIILGVLGGFASVCEVIFHGLYSAVRFFALESVESDEDDEERTPGGAAAKTTA